MQCPDLVLHEQGERRLGAHAAIRLRDRVPRDQPVSGHIVGGGV